MSKQGCSRQGAAAAPSLSHIVAIIPQKDDWQGTRSISTHASTETHNSSAQESLGPLTKHAAHPWSPCMTLQPSLSRAQRVWPHHPSCLAATTRHGSPRSFAPTTSSPPHDSTLLATKSCSRIVVNRIAATAGHSIEMAGQGCSLLSCLCCAVRTLLKALSMRKREKRGALAPPVRVGPGQIMDIRDDLPQGGAPRARCVLYHSVMRPCHRRAVVMTRQKRHPAQAQRRRPGWQAPETPLAAAAGCAPVGGASSALRGGGKAVLPQTEQAEGREKRRRHARRRTVARAHTLARPAVPLTADDPARNAAGSLEEKSLSFASPQAPSGRRAQ